MAETAASGYSQVPQKGREVEMTSPGKEAEDGVVPTASGNEDAICLKPKMSLLNGITVIVGSIIGSGIFVSPKGVLENTGSVGLSLTVWIISGVFSTIGAYCYAELGCMITKTGADYAYIMMSFGPFVAFIRLWIECMIVRPCSQAIVALTFSFYVLRPIFPDCDPPADAVRYLACICIDCEANFTCLYMAKVFYQCPIVGWRVHGIFSLSLSDCAGVGLFVSEATTDKANSNACISIRGT